MREHLFVALYEEEEVRFKYPSKEDAEIHDHFANELLSKDPAVQDQAFKKYFADKKENPLVILKYLTQKYPESFFAHNTLGNLYRDLDDYTQSIPYFHVAEIHAPNTTLKFSALTDIASSWKTKGDDEQRISILENIFGKEIFTRQIAAQAAVYYDKAAAAYKEANKYSYAATPIRAITNTFNQATLALSYALLANKYPADLPVLAEKKTKLIHLAKAGKILTVQLQNHYHVSGIDEELALFEKDLKTLQNFF